MKKTNSQKYVSRVKKSRKIAHEDLSLAYFVTDRSGSNIIYNQNPCIQGKYRIF